jgi:hypothetical protein
MPAVFKTGDLKKAMGDLAPSHQPLATALNLLVGEGALIRLYKGCYRKRGATETVPIPAPANGSNSHRISLPPESGGSKPRFQVPDEAHLPAAPRPPNQPIASWSAEAVQLCSTLPAVFAPTDLDARIPKDRSGIWLAEWMARRWIERVGFNQYRKTDLFGKRPVATKA